VFILARRVNLEVLKPSLAFLITPPAEPAGDNQQRPDQGAIKIPVGAPGTRAGNRCLGGLIGYRCRRYYLGFRLRRCRNGGGLLDFLCKVTGALLEFANGATVTLSASWDVWKNRHPNMELYGTQASLYVPDPNFFGGEVQIAGGEGDPVDLDTASHPFGKPNMQDGQGRDRANYRCAGLADMAAAIDEGRQHRCDADLAVHAVDVMTGILRAGAERRFVDLSTTCERPAALSAAEADSRRAEDPLAYAEVISWLTLRLSELRDDHSSMEFAPELLAWLEENPTEFSR